MTPRREQVRFHPLSVDVSPPARPGVGATSQNLPFGVRRLVLVRVSFQTRAGVGPKQPKTKPETRYTPKGGERHSRRLSSLRPPLLSSLPVTLTVHTSVGLRYVHSRSVPVQTTRTKSACGKRSVIAPLLLPLAATHHTGELFPTGKPWLQSSARRTGRPSRRGARGRTSGYPTSWRPRCVRGACVRSPSRAGDWLAP